MKTLTTIFPAIFACASTCFAQDPHVSEEAFVTAPPHGPLENAMSLQRIYDAFAAGNANVLNELISDDVVWNEAESFPYADRNPYLGKKAVFDGVFGRISTEWDYFRLTDIQIFPMYDDRVIATGFYECMYKKNAKPVKIQMAHLCRFKNGKLIEFQQFADTKKAADAVIEKDEKIAKN